MVGLKANPGDNEKLTQIRGRNCHLKVRAHQVDFREEAKHLTYVHKVTAPIDVYFKIAIT